MSFWATSMPMKYDAPKTSESLPSQVLIFHNPGDLFFLLSTVVACVLDSELLHLHDCNLQYGVLFPDRSLLSFQLLLSFLLDPFFNLIEIFVSLTFNFLIYPPFPASPSSPFSLRHVVCHLDEFLTTSLPPLHPCSSTPAADLNLGQF